jgi:1,4-dihydroxy-2-naphthoate octaprenyltransferase
MNVKLWFKETRPSFLLLTPIAFSIGLSVAYVEGHFEIFRAALGLIGVVLAHVSINVFNDFFDYKSGLDFRTEPTPFSGGSGMLTSGAIKPRDAYLFALASMLLGGLIGLYFVLTTSWMLIPLIAVAVFSIYLYTSFLANYYVGELITGINFGPLMSMGGYFILAGRFNLLSLAAGIVPGILVGNLLLLNEFPDVYADKNVGRKNVVIKLGTETASKIYGALIALIYVWIIACIFLQWMPLTVLVAFVTLPLAVKTVKGVINNHDNIPNLIPSMGGNVKLTLWLTGMTTIGILLSLLQVN